MLFRAATVLALLAANVAAEAQPYKLSGPVLGMSLMRRSTYGYQPEQSVCGDGSTCSEACGSGYETCASTDGDTHCYDPTANQSCCFDGSGNSCDKGYYCAHDTSLNTWCCPDDLSLSKCAKKFGVDELETSAVIATSASSTASASSTSEAKLSTTSTTIKVTSTWIPSTPVAEEDTAVATPTAAYTTAWTGSNSTVAGVTPASTYQTPLSSSSATSSVAPAATGGAAASGVSALLLVAAGLVALL